MTESKTVAFLIAPEGTERIELVSPWDAAGGAGHEAVLLSTKEGKAQTLDHLD